MLGNLLGHQWEQQISLFPRLTLRNFEEDKLLAVNVIPDDLNAFKEKLRKVFKHAGFLVIVRELKRTNEAIRGAYNKPIKQIYVTVYSSIILDKDKLREVINLTYDDRVNYKKRLVEEQKLIKACKTIKKYKLHDIQTLLKTPSKLKRWTVLNGKYLIKTTTAKLLSDNHID